MHTCEKNRFLAKQLLHTRRRRWIQPVDPAQALQIVHEWISIVCGWEFLSMARQLVFCLVAFSPESERFHGVIRGFYCSLGWVSMIIEGYVMRLQAPLDIFCRAFLSLMPGETRSDSAGLAVGESS